MPTIEFLIEKKKIKVGKFANLKTACRKNGIGGAGGVVEIVDGMKNLSPRTAVEKLILRGEPETYRLAGEVEVLGDVCVITNFTPKPSRQ